MRLMESFRFLTLFVVIFIWFYVFCFGCCSVLFWKAPSLGVCRAPAPITRRRRRRRRRLFWLCAPWWAEPSGKLKTKMFIFEKCKEDVVDDGFLYFYCGWRRMAALPNYGNSSASFWFSTLLFLQCRVDVGGHYGPYAVPHFLPCRFFISFLPLGAVSPFGVRVRVGFLPNFIGFYRVSLGFV